jgi:hypothetical protein
MTPAMLVRSSSPVTQNAFLNSQTGTPTDLLELIMNALHLSLFATGKITFFPWHDATWMEDIEYDEGDEHWERV